MSIIEIIIIFTLVLAIFLAGTLIGALKNEYDDFERKSLEEKENKPINAQETKNNIDNV